MNLGMLKQYLALFQSEILVVQAAFREKGLRRFLRPIAIGAGSVALCYAALYSPPAKKMASLQKRIETARRTAQHADQYKALRDRLNQVYAQLPALRQRQSWLADALIDTMKARGIIADSISPPEEDERSGLVFQRIQVATQLRFQDLMAWLARIEETKPLLHVNNLEVGKRPLPLGRNNVTVGLSTIVPVRRATP